MNAQVQLDDDDEDADGTDPQEILSQAKKRLALCIEADGDNHRDGLDDLKFLSGDQWDEKARRERQLDGRPCLTINKLPTFLHQVTNDQRQNVPGLKVAAVDGDADVETAEVLQGMIRHMEYSSNADVAYDTAVNSAAAIGFGYFRLVTDYTAPDSFDQEIRFKRIRNPFTVYFDPASEEPDGSDAMFVIITSKMDKAEFRRQYPDAEAGAEGFEVGAGDATHNNWLWEDSVRVAEYYRIVNTAATLVQLSNGETGWKDKLVSMPPGVKVVRERLSARRTVEWHKVTALDVLETVEIKCNWIPVFPVYGDELDIDGKVIRSGLIRNAKDPAKMYNFWMPLSLDTPLVTPRGWTTMRDVKPGDELFASDGQPTTVLGVSPVHINRECFRVEFDDGCHIVADKQHPWVVEERGKRKAATYEWTTKTLSTGELVPGKHFIYATQPLDLPTADLPIDPYVLGYWLGDGCADAPSFTASLEDYEETSVNFTSAGYTVGPKHNSKRAGDAATFSIYGLVPTFRENKLLFNKHIPSVYLRASIEQRLELLRGLMDSDGSISSTYLCSFSNSSTVLIDGINELLKSLGIKCATLKRASRQAVFGSDVFTCLESYVVSFTAPDLAVFKLSRKLNRQLEKSKRHARRTKRHRIKAVVAVPSVPVKCVAIDAPSHLFLAGSSMIPTHNTAATEEVALRPKTPYIGAEGVFEGYEEDWAQANVRSFPYLEYRPVTLDGQMAPAPARQPMADIPSGVLMMANHANDNIKATTGLFDSSLGNRGNATSGIQEQSQQRQGDIANLHFSDNLNRSIRQAGRCIVSMIPNYYDAERIVKVMGDDGTLDHKTINTPSTQNVPQSQAPGAPPAMDPTGQPQQDPETGEMLVAIDTVLHDLSVGTYEVTLRTGPSYSTLRQEAADSMIQFGKSWPKLMDVAGDKVVNSFDWPGAEEIAERIKRTIPPAILGPDQDGGEQPQMVQTPKGPIPAAQAGQMLEQMDQQMQQMGQQLSDAKSGITRIQIETASRERIAQMEVQAEQAREAARVQAEASASLEKSKRDADGRAQDNVTKLDITELQGMVALLVARAKANDALKADVTNTLMSNSIATPTATGADKAELKQLIQTP